MPNDNHDSQRDLRHPTHENWTHRERNTREKEYFIVWQRERKVFSKMIDQNESIMAGGPVVGVDISESMILMATSNLGGNIWDASLRVIDLATKKVVASVQPRSGCADVCWAGVGQRAICAEDSGDVKVRSD